MGLQAKVNLEVGTCFGFAFCCHRATQPKLYSSFDHKKIEMCVCKLLCRFFPIATSCIAFLGMSV